MFTKQDIEKMMADNKGKTFVIKTNTANGHGINGVSYDTHMSYRVHTERGIVSYAANVEVTELVIKEITDSMLVLDKTVEKFEKSTYNGGLQINNKRKSHTTLYMPYDTIQTIEFIEEDAEFYGYFHDSWRYKKDEELIKKL